MSSEATTPVKAVTFFEQLTEIAGYAGKDLNKSTTLVTYQNIKNPADNFTNPDEFINRGLLGSDYKKEVSTYKLKQKLFFDMFGEANPKLTDDIKLMFRLFQSVLVDAELVPAGTGTHLSYEHRVRKEGEDFNKTKLKLTNKINALEVAEKAGTLTAVEETELSVLRGDLVQLYINKGVTPKENSKIYKFWNETEKPEKPAFTDEHHEKVVAFIDGSSKSKSKKST